MHEAGSSPDPVRAQPWTVEAQPGLQVAVVQVHFPVGQPLRRPISRTYFHRRAWAPAVKGVGLPVGTRFHELCHFYASLLIDGGESVKAVQVPLGHATAEETLNTYAHLWPESEERTLEAVDRGLGTPAHYRATSPS